MVAGATAVKLSDLRMTSRELAISVVTVVFTILCMAGLTFVFRGLS